MISFTDSLKGLTDLLLTSMPIPPPFRTVGILDVQMGAGVQWIAPCNLYGCTIGEDCFIGPFVEIQRGAVIGKRCRIQSHSFICEKVTILDDCFIGHGVMFTNDLFQAGGPSGNPANWKPTLVGNRVSIGSNSTLLPVTIADGTVIGAGSVVTKDITEPGFYAGNPARKLRSLG
jgi:acetyltransferase-like isoleucine patch superfamily enzyme